MVENINKQTYGKCQAITGKGTQCTNRSIWEQYCKRHHPKKQTIPYWANKRNPGRAVRATIDAWFLNKWRVRIEALETSIKEGNETAEIIEAVIAGWEEYEDDKDIVYIRDELEEWKDNVEEHFPSKAEEIEDCLYDVEEAVEYVEDSFPAFVELVREKKWDEIDFDEVYSDIEGFESAATGPIYPSMFG